MGRPYEFRGKHYRTLHGPDRRYWSMSPGGRETFSLMHSRYERLKGRRDTQRHWSVAGHLFGGRIHSQ